MSDSEQALGAIFEGAAIAMAVTHPDGHFERVNTAMCELLGHTAEELLGMTFRDITHPDDLAASLAHHTRAREGEIAERQLVKRYVHRDGRTVWGRLSCAAVGGSGGSPRYFIAQVQDITAEREAVQARTELAAVVEFSADAIITATLDGTIRSWNAGAERIYGYSATEMIGADETLLAAGAAEHEQQSQVRAQIVAGEHAEPFEALRRTKDGTVVEMSIALSPVLDADGAVIGISTVARDISERKRAERALAHSRDLLAQAEPIAQIGSWQWDLATDRVSWSAGVNEIFKLKRDEISATQDARATIEYWASRVNPEDRELVCAALKQTISELTGVSLRGRAIRADGRVSVLEWQAEPIVDKDGMPVRVIGVVRDITDTEHKQEALHAVSLEPARYARELRQPAVSPDAVSKDPAPGAFTARQLDILRLVSHGLTNAEIAKRLFISESTVKFHVKQILLKTNSVNRTEAVARVFGADAGKLDRRTSR